MAILILLTVSLAVPFYACALRQFWREFIWLRARRIRGSAVAVPLGAQHGTGGNWDLRAKDELPTAAANNQRHSVAIAKS
jgi:hypothetical protein